MPAPAGFLQEPRAGERPVKRFPLRLLMREYLPASRGTCRNCVPVDREGRALGGTGRRTRPRREHEFRLSSWRHRRRVQARTGTLGDRRCGRHEIQGRQNTAAAIGHLCVRFDFVGLGCYDMFAARHPRREDNGHSRSGQAKWFQ